MLNFELIGDPAIAPQMAKYMKNQFPFLGLKAPMRQAQTKPLLKDSRQQDLPVVHHWIETLYQQDAREYQYAAVDVAYSNIKRWTFDDMSTLSAFVGIKSWWDTVDAWRKVFGQYVALHPEALPAIFQLFYKHPDFWMRRVAINLQFMAKENTDTALLTQAILADQDTDEFFIQKAIGWSLRQYSKSNPSWVRQFISTQTLSPLAVREGSKYL